MADSVQAGPRKPVPPRIRMRNGLGAWTADSAAASAPGKSGAIATAAAEEARNSRRVTVMAANSAHRGAGVKLVKGLGSKESASQRHHQGGWPHQPERRVHPAGVRVALKLHICGRNPSSSGSTYGSPSAGVPAPEPVPAAAQRLPQLLWQPAASQPVWLIPPTPGRSFARIEPASGRRQAETPLKFRL